MDLRRFVDPAGLLARRLSNDTPSLGELTRRSLLPRSASRGDRPRSRSRVADAVVDEFPSPSTRSSTNTDPAAGHRRVAGASSGSGPADRRRSATTTRQFSYSAIRFIHGPAHATADAIARPHSAPLVATAPWTLPRAISPGPSPICSPAPGCYRERQLGENPDFRETASPNADGPTVASHEARTTDDFCGGYPTTK